jgi:hypothetical protein
MRIAFDPIYCRPGGPKVQKAFGGLDEPTLRRLFPESTWLLQETYLMTLYEATPENLETMRAMRTAKDETIAIFADDPNDDVGVEILNTGVLYCTLPPKMGWQTAKEWAQAILTVAATAERLGYPATLADVSDPAKTIEEAFKMVTTMPRQDGGFLQWLLMQCLKTPLATHALLVEGLQAIPDALLRQKFPEDPFLKRLVERMIVLAKKDARFLQNYLNGIPVADFY